MFLISSMVFFTAALILLFLFNRHPTEKMQFPAERKRLSEIFATLDTANWKNKDTSLLLTNEAIRLSKKINDSDAFAMALYNQANILQGYDNNDSVLVTGNRALAITEKLHNDTLTAKIKNTIGNYYHSMDNYYLSMLYYSDVDKIADKLNDNHLKGLASDGLGLVYLSLNDYEKAIGYFTRADSAFRGSDKDEIRNIESSLLHLGGCYFNKNELSKASYYHEEALEIAKKLNDTDMMCRIFINLGLICQGQEDTANALKYFQQAICFSKQVDNRRMFATATYDLGRFYFYSGDSQLGQAEKYFNQSMSIFSEIGFRSAEMKTNMALSNVFLKKKHWEKAYDYYAKYVALNDSILNAETQKKISDYQWEIESQKKKYEQEILQNKYEIQKKRNLIFGVITVFVIITAIMISRNFRKSLKYQKLKNTYLQDKVETGERINILEKLRYQSEIEAKNKELTTTSIQVITKNDILTIIEELAEKSFQNDQMDKITYNNLKTILKENLNLDKDWEQFKKMFEQVHQDFFTNLKKICPELTENEIRLCAYIRINLQNKEIAKMLNVIPATVATTRYHIRKKLNLDKQTSLEDYIRKI